MRQQSRPGAGVKRFLLVGYLPDNCFAGYPFIITPSASKRLETYGIGDLAKQTRVTLSIKKAGISGLGIFPVGGVTRPLAA